MHSLLINRSRQRGAVTLIITVLVLLAVSVGAVGMVQNSTLETRMTINERNAREALQAAQAGVEHVLAGLALIRTNEDSTDGMSVAEVRDFICSHGNPNFELNFEGPVNENCNDPSSPTALRFDSNFAEIDGETCSLSTPIQICEDLLFGVLTQLRVWSRGYSADGESLRTVTSLIDMNLVYYTDYDDSGSGGGRAPVVTKSDVHLQGTPDVALCVSMSQCQDLASSGKKSGGLVEGNLIIAGGEVSGGGSILKSDLFETDEDGNPVHYTENDNLIRDMPTSELFNNFVSKDISYEEFTSTGNPAVLNISDHKKNDVIDTSQSQLLYYKATPDSKGKTEPFTLRNGTLGTPDAPVVLVVDGDLNLAGNAIIWGVVFVTGNADFSTGTNKIMGSLVTQGDIEMKGNAAVYYNNNLLPRSLSNPSSAPSNIGVRRATMRVGSWREVTN